MKARHAMLVALVGVAVFAVIGRSAQSQTASPTLSAGSIVSAGAPSSKLAFIRYRRIACCGGVPPFELYVMNADGSGKRLLKIDVGRGFALSPDGRKFAFTGGRDGKIGIYVINADGSRKRRLTSNAGNNFSPAWSPDGRKIAFCRGVGPHCDQIYVMNADGSGQRRLTRLPEHNGDPVWLPDGRKIAFVSFRDRTAGLITKPKLPLPIDPQIHLMNADGTGQRNLTRDWGLNFPVWSPDGQKIAFTSKRDGNWEVYVMNADGTGQRNLTRNAANDNLFGTHVWSPDGRKIVFGRDRDGDGGYDDIHLINADGSGHRKLTQGRSPLWSPDGQKIAFQSKPEGNWAEISVINADGSGQQRLTRSPARTFNGSLVWLPAQK